MSPEQRPRPAAAGGGTKACGSVSRALLLARGRVLHQIAGDRVSLVEPGAGSLAQVARGDRANALGPGLHVLDRRSAGEGAAIPTGELRLVVLRINGVGDQPGLR